MPNDALMVDLETMSTRAEAAIVSIGACMFDMHAGPEQEIAEHNRFLRRISLESNQAAGRHLDANTVIWWLQQSDEARRGLTDGAITNLKIALIELRMWFQHDTDCRPATCWANSPEFDISILRSANEAVGETWPVFFSLNRDVRTCGELAYPDARERKAVMKACRDATGEHHRADADAVAQALFVAHCIEALK